MANVKEIRVGKHGNITTGGRPDTSGRWVTINGHHVHIGGQGGLKAHNTPSNVKPARNDMPLYKHAFVRTPRGSVVRTRPMTPAERKRWMRG